MLAADERLAHILTAREIPAITPSRNSAFQSLSRSVVGQQLSSSAAHIIWGRCKSLVRGWKPDRVLATPRAVLRDAGVSNAKARTLHELASYFLSRNRPARFSSMADDAVRSELTRIWGVGKWTADMFLMFHLGRQDVFPDGDGAIQSAMIRLYGTTLAGSGEKRQLIALRWSPHRTLACRILWDWVDS